MSHLIDCGTYVEYNYEQMSPDWFGVKKGKLSSSSFGAAAGVDKYQSKEQLTFKIKNERRTLLGLPEIESREEVVVNKQSEEDKLRHTTRGIVTEPTARQWFEKKYDCDVTAIGFAVPKWNTDIGCSPDGAVYENEQLQHLIEIKCPERMPHLLVEFENHRRNNTLPELDEYYHGHIYPSHYAQMQGCLAILDCEYNYYIVYCPNENKCIVNKIRRNRKYWEEFLYPNILDVLEKSKP